VPIAPANLWSSTYESKLKDSFAIAVDAATSLLASQNFWRSWIFQNTTGMQSAVPLFPTTATFNQALFNPLPFGGPPPATILATAWNIYMLGAIWTIVPPAPPFSVITTIVTDPASTSAAYATLLASLTAEFLLLPAPTEAGFDSKISSIAGHFRTATSSCSIMISGLALVGAPPPPVVLIVPTL
jgi:hypothetical protein